MIHESNLDNSLKEKIFFIDLPGLGNNDIFEKNIYSKLKFSFKAFIFAGYRGVKDYCNEKILNDLYATISKDIFISNCLFIINCDKTLDISEKALLKTKNDIVEVIRGLNCQNLNELNACFFNAKYFE